ncbi:MAG: hypothetical protein J07HQW2_03879 [Haloquadratum walsbyi J07HQW2]|uniref:Uncharacterized protein n=1 Tax=Haloquadratum walsbyi J07HQW2 TaxID=1238425 RepID=U1NKB1_9EURY|nr:MAG: hypothetical protein J07HQW2_03879 [Haloquadratum walsbyi J07HQW2]
MVEVVGVADELPRASHGDVVVNVAVHAKDSRILGFLRTARVYFPFHRGVEIELVGVTVVVDSAGRKLVVVVQQVLAMWCTFRVGGQVVLALDPSVDRGKAHFVAVVGGGALVVDDAECVVLWLAGIFVVSQSVYTAVDVVSGAFDGFLDEIRVQPVGFFAEVIIDCVFSFAFAGHAVLFRVAPRPVCGAVSAVLESIVGGVEVTLAVVGHVKADMDRSSHLPRHVFHGNSYTLLIFIIVLGESVLP